MMLRPEPDYGGVFAKKHPVTEAEAPQHGLRHMAVVPGSDRISMTCTCGRTVTVRAAELYPDMKKAQEAKNVANE